MPFYAEESNRLQIVFSLQQLQLGSCAAAPVGIGTLETTSTMSNETHHQHTTPFASEAVSSSAAAQGRMATSFSTGVCRSGEDHWHAMEKVVLQRTARKEREATEGGENDLSHHHSTPTFHTDDVASSSQPETKIANENDEIFYQKDEEKEESVVPVIPRQRVSRMTWRDVNPFRYPFVLPTIQRQKNPLDDENSNESNQQQKQKQKQAKRKKTKEEGDKATTFDNGVHDSVDTATSTSSSRTSSTDGVSKNNSSKKSELQNTVGNIGEGDDAELSSGGGHVLPSSENELLVVVQLATSAATLAPDERCVGAIPSSLSYTEEKDSGSAEMTTTCITHPPPHTTATSSSSPTTAVEKITITAPQPQQQFSLAGRGAGAGGSGNGSAAAGLWHRKETSTGGSYPAPPPPLPQHQQQQRQEHHVRFEEIVCRDFYNGSCERGASCRFQHVKHGPETIQLIKESLREVGAGTLQLTLCKDYQLGQCFRPRCRFVHENALELSNLGVVLSADPTQQGGAASEGMVCQDFLAGHCKRTNCRFLHTHPWQR